jgi:hypothetical protein
MSMSLDVVFAYVVGMLAGLAVIGALAFALVWEWCAIRRTLAAHRRQAPGEGSFWRDHAAVTIRSGGHENHHHRPAGRLAAGRAAARP